jgi:hypothetical protein
MRSMGLSKKVAVQRASSEVYASSRGAAAGDDLDHPYHRESLGWFGVDLEPVAEEDDTSGSPRIVKVNSYGTLEVDI